MSQSDWRSPASYTSAEVLDHTGFAWECLRRNPDYRRDFLTVSKVALDPSAVAGFRKRWGLSFRR
ncbi:transcriptional regulator domain-containing protein [Rhodopseudomonas parapalustris]